MLTTHPFNSKRDVSDFVAHIKNDQRTTQDVNLLTSIFKLAFLMNVIVENNVRLHHKNYISGITYDILNSVIAIIDHKERYLYLNIRSMIEHIARIALDKCYNGSDFDGTVRRKDFDYLKKERASENWKYMHENYTKACQFIHSSPEAKLNIKAKFMDLLSNDSSTKPSKQIIHLQRIVSALSLIFIKYYELEISSVFYRSQGELKYILGASLYKEYELFAQR